MFHQNLKFTKNYFCLIFFLFLCVTAGAAPAQAYWMWSPENGKFVSSDTNVQDHSNELFQHALGFHKEKQDDRAIEEFENLIRKYPNVQMAAEAQYQIGIIYEDRLDYDRAFEAYRKLTENYPQNEHIEEVAERLFKMGNLFLAGRKGKVLGMSIKSGTSKAVEIFEHVVKAAPFSKYGDQSQFHVGLAYKQMGQYQSAIQAFQKLIDQYPNSTFLDDAHYQLAETSYEYSKRATRDEHAMDEAIENISDFLSRYPESNLTEKVTQLKREINKKDAEKNYRIGLYYEKENELESAALYYEDVTKRYPDTEYGKEAAKKLELLREPIKGMKSEKEALEAESKSVAEKLKGLESEREKLGKGKDAQLAEEKRKLEEQIQLLKRKQTTVKESQTGRFREREESLKRSEKEWREKWQTLELKRKEMKNNPAPELTRAFERWQKSLTEEKEQLAHERQTVASLRNELAAQNQKPKHEWHLPSLWGRGRSLIRVMTFKFKDLNKIRSERDKITAARMSKENETAQAMSELYELEQLEFQAARDEQSFQALVKEEGGDLQTKQDTLGKRRSELNDLIHRFEGRKAEYAKTYGGENLQKWTLGESVKSLRTADEFAASGLPLEEVLRGLQQDKAALSDAWMKQRSIVDTVSNAFDHAAKKPAEAAEKTVSPAETEVWEGLPDAIKNLDHRSLRKRIKFLEREIRARYDEIEDWDAKKDKAIADLDELMHHQKRKSITSKFLRPITFPVRFTFWLARSLALGLNDNDKKVMKQAARQKPDSIDENDFEKIRSLQEEIELESLMIQGRHEEIATMQKELVPLRGLGKSKGIELRPIFLERSFLIGEESLQSANRLIPDENRREILIQKLDQETQKLKQFEDQLNSLDKKIDQLQAKQAVMKVSAVKSTDKKKKESETSDAEEPGQKKFEEEITQLKQEIETGEKQYQAEKDSVDQALREFYKKKQSENKGRSENQLSVKQKEIAIKKSELNQRVKKLNREVQKWKGEERALIGSERAVIEKKKKLLQKELDHLGNHTDNPNYPTFLSELESVEAELVSLNDIEKDLNNVKGN